MVVTKGRTQSEIEPVVASTDSTLIGESRWQDTRSKYFHFSPHGDNTYPLQRQGWAKDLELHFIGRLQSNKLKYIVPHYDCIESVSSVELLEGINKVATSRNVVRQIMLQVNVSDDEHKAGFQPDVVSTALAHAESLQGVRVIGLMAITARQKLAATVKDFEVMKQLQNATSLPELSMGMSADWQQAVESGASIVRVGSALFE